MARTQISSPPKKERKEGFLFPSGCTLFNLACSGNYRGFSPKGKTVNIIGDSNAGKSMLVLTILSAIYHKFNEEFILIHDDVECANTFDMEALFGKKFSMYLQKPPVPYGAIATVENFVRNIKKLSDIGKPFVYVLDSWDALKTESDNTKLEELVEGEVKASYKTDKARVGSDWLGWANGVVSQAGGLLIIVSQSKVNIGINSMFQPKTRSGGASLRYYSSIECWLAIGGRIQSAVHKMPIGTKCVLKVSRSRITGKERTVNFPILNVYGIDDTLANVEYMVEMNAFKKKGSYIIPVGLFEGQDEAQFQKKELVSIIERDNLTLRLRKMVQNTWDEIEAEIAKEMAGRTPKFEET